MAIEKVKAYFKNYGMEDRVMEKDSSSATVEEAADVLGCEPGRIAKTLSFHLDEKVILIVTAGDKKIDNKKYRTEFGSKAHMLKFEEVELLVGHAVGGVCPFALPDPKPSVYLDISLQRFETVFPACGSSNSAIELAPDELFRYAGAAAWIDICRPFERA